MATRADMDIVANALGVSPATVRFGLEQGVLPFGAAIKCDKRYSYVFFRSEVRRLLGVEIGSEGIDRERKEKD